MELKSIRNEVSDTVRYQFEGDITINSVGKLKKILMNELLKSPEVELDMNHVDKFDTAGYQLFLYLGLEAKKRKKRIRIVRKSANVLKVLDLFGEPV